MQGNDDQFVVGGSDDGKAYIWDRKTGDAAGSRDLRAKGASKNKREKEQEGKRGKGGERDRQELATKR